MFFAVKEPVRIFRPRECGGGSEGLKRTIGLRQPVALFAVKKKANRLFRYQKHIYARKHI
jgi:hypothetical protein